MADRGLRRYVALTAINYGKELELAREKIKQLEYDINRYTCDICTTNLGEHASFSTCEQCGVRAGDNCCNFESYHWINADLCYNCSEIYKCSNCKKYNADNTCPDCSITICRYCSDGFECTICGKFDEHGFDCLNCGTFMCRDCSDENTLCKYCAETAASNICFCGKLSLQYAECSNCSNVFCKECFDLHELCKDCSKEIKCVICEELDEHYINCTSCDVVLCSQCSIDGYCDQCAE